MGNKLSAEEPQHVKALKSKPNILKEPAFQYYTAGWRECEFDNDAEEFSFAACREPPSYDGDDEKEGPTDHRDERHASKDDFKNLQFSEGNSKNDRLLVSTALGRRGSIHQTKTDAFQQKQARKPQSDVTGVDLKKSLHSKKSS